MSLKSLIGKEMTSNISDQEFVDFDLHGVVTVRFVDPSPAMAASYARRWEGALLPAGAREPDIVVTFQETLAPRGLTHVGRNSAGFSEDGFFLLDERTGKVRAGISFETIGDCCKIVCPRKTSSVPLLSEIINLTSLQKGHVPLHASALLYEGTGVLIAGWSKGGKTGALLSFMEHGAHFVADEWVILSGNGQKMLGVPESIAISEWQFRHIPALMPKVGLQVGPQKRLFFKSVHAVDFAYERLLPQKLKKSFPGKLLGMALPRLKRQLKIYKAPRALFGDQFGPLRARPERFFLIAGHDRSEISVEPCDPREFAERVAEANEYEWRDFFNYYGAFKFAFPHMENEFLENALNVQRSLLCQALEGKKTYLVLHPYGGPLEPLFTRIQSRCVKPTPDSVAAAEPFVPSTI